MQWLTKSLNRKFAAGTAAGLLMSSLFFLVLFMSLYRGQLERERSVAADQVSRLVQASLRGLMRDGDLAGLGDRVRRLKEEEGILDVKIVDLDGRIRVATDEASLGQVVMPPQGRILGHGLDLIDDEAGRSVLRSSKPISGPIPGSESHKEPSYTGAAQSAPSAAETPMADQSVGGTLYVDFDATPIRLKARTTTLFLMGSGALIVLINLAGGWWFMRRYVVRPVARLSEASLRWAAGDLDARINLPGHDEFSLLANRFNGMAESLHHKMHELEDKEDYLQALVDAIPDGVRVIDEDFRVVLSNASYRRQLGYTDAQPPPDLCYAATHGRDNPCPGKLTLCTLKEVAASGEPLRLVHRHLRTDGAKFDVEVYAAPVRVVRDGHPRRMVVESIRDLRQEIRFSHEQRLSELGRLAAGVAHEIHNPLTSLRMALHAAEQINQAPDADRVRLAENLTLVMQQVEQCERVTERLLKLSMPPSSQPELVELESVLDDTLKLVAWEAETGGVRTELRIDGAPPRVLATDSDLRMMALNLAQNACHAMPRGGHLTVCCGRDDAHVVLLFEDTGVGIDPGDLQSIFEPFFSRRADGVRGTGLGLPITKAIIESHGGTIDVDSAHGEGSRFTVRFPDADADAVPRVDIDAVAAEV
ncbi:MAG: ATP-binding protein [Thiohalocapsa sp.]